MNEMREYIKSNNLMLTKSQIETLKKYNINYEQNVKMILYEIDQILNDDYDEVLDEIGNVIAEMDYYNNTNKQKNFINGKSNLNFMIQNSQLINL